MTIRALLLSLAVILAVVAGIGGLTTDRYSKTVSVLFIGNSLTSANNLPAMVAAIAKSQDVEVIHDAHVPGGTRLRDHAADKSLLGKLRKRSWDFVVLQEQSELPSFGAAQVSTDVFPYAARLAEESRMANPETSLIFYMTMAHRKSDPDNQDGSSDLYAYDDMQSRIYESYVTMAQDNQALVAPVGEAWRRVREEHPDIVLYADENHPNPTGTYLAACVFYATLLQSPCSGAAVPGQVDDAIAESLQKTADEVVLTSGYSWDWRE